MSLATINSQYNGLNGLVGSYGGNYSFNADAAKDNIIKFYDVNSTRNAYGNKHYVELKNYTEQCQTIHYLVQSGRTEEAMNKYNTLMSDMKNSSNYEGYSDNEIKTLLQEQYANATGKSLVADIEESSAPSSFGSGFLKSIPIVGALSETTSKDDFIAEVTGTEKSKGSKVADVAGKATGVLAGAGTGAAIGAVVGFGVPGAIVGGIIGGAVSLFSSIFTGK